MATPLLVIAAGGTGGHMFPAQALAEAMLEKGWRVRLSTDARGARYTGGFPTAVEITQVRSATFARGGILAKLLVPLKIAGGIVTAVSAMRRDRPAVVVGFGGYPSIPAMAAAWLTRTPRMIHEQNGVLGRVNQLFVKRVNKVACGTWPTELPNGVTGIHTGNPVRAAILEKAASKYLAPNDAALNVLVTGGSQAARILSDVVPEAIARLPQALRDKVNVNHQARPEDVERVKEHYARNGIAANVQSFFNDMPKQLELAQLVVARSGASTVADITVIGRPAIYVPLAAAIRDEQTANARGSVSAGAALLISESELDAADLSAQIATILRDPARAMEMSKAALSCGKPDATQQLVSIVESLATDQKA